MIGRKTVLVAALMALLLFVTSGTVLVAQWPHRGWSWMFAHYPAMERAYLIFWLSLPMVFTAFLLIVLTTAFVQRDKPVTPGQRRLVDGGVIGVGLLSIISEIVHVGSLFAYRTQRAAYVGAGGNAHAFHFDSHFIVTRIGMALAGLFTIWLGNRLPKLAAPPASQPDRQDQAAKMRLGGWVFVAAGVGMIACAFVTPFLRALEVDLAITAAVVVIWTAIHWIYQLGGPSSTASPL